MPVSRLLVLHQHADPAGDFLTAAAEICRRFDSRPLVLTVARSDSEARRRRRAAEATLAARGQSGDFDIVVGGDVRSAVAWVARWRRCSHVVVAKRHSRGSWRWLHGDPVERLLGVSDRLTLLALPDAGGRPVGECPTERNFVGRLTGAARFLARARVNCVTHRRRSPWLGVVVGS